MNNLLSKRDITFVLLICVLVADVSSAKDRTLPEFRDYVAGKAPNFTPAQLDTMAKGVDRNGDGTISAAEFEKRMEIFQAVVSGKPLPDRAKALPPQEPPHGASNDHRHNSDSTVLLITAEKLKAAWQPFANWKTRNGKATTIITVMDIAKRYKATSIQEKIRFCVRDHIDQHAVNEYGYCCGAIIVPLRRLSPTCCRTFLCYRFARWRALPNWSA